MFSHFPGRTPSAPLVPIFSPLPYQTTSNSICIVIALVNSTIWHWSSSDSLCLGCIKSGDADTVNACVWVCLFVCVSGGNWVECVTQQLLPYALSFFKTSTIILVNSSVYQTWSVQVSPFISMQIQRRHREATWPLNSAESYLQMTLCNHWSLIAALNQSERQYHRPDPRESLYMSTKCNFSWSFFTSCL